MNSSTFPHTKPPNPLLNKIFTLFIHTKSKNNRFPLIFSFVTIRNTNGYKHPSKRCPFTLQKGVFYNAKGRRLKSKKERIWQIKGGTQKEGDPKPKRRSLPKPLRRRGCERIRWDMGGSLSLELRPPRDPPGGGDVPGGIRIAGCWGNRRTKI